MWQSTEEFGFIKKKIDYWGPGHKIQTFLTNVLERPDLFEREPFKIVTYEDSEKNRYQRSFSLDFNQWENLTRFPSKLSDIAKTLKDIERHLKNLPKNRN